MNTPRTVVILAAGYGTRMKTIMMNKNKCLAEICGKSSIEHAINHFSDSDEIIVILGDDDTYTESYLLPRLNKNVKFIYTARRNGIGHSLSEAREFLQKPFIIWYCDTLLNEDLPDNNYSNWVICSKQYQEKYKNYTVVNSDTKEMILNKDLNVNTGNNNFYIGISFVRDYLSFWNSYAYNQMMYDRWGDIAYMNNMKNYNVYCTDKWYDLGNVESYTQAKEELEHHE